MKLLRLHVENFGVLKDYKLELSDGVNLLYEENGWGKSTLAVFIKAMLYGLPATSKRSLDENERKKYTPWQGGAFGGSLEFECANGSYRVERFFGAKESADTFSLYDLSTNKPSSAYSASLGEELFGIDADGFERSVYLSQRFLADKGESPSISARLGSLLDDVDDMGSYEDAMLALEKRRKFYVLTGNRGAIADTEQARLAAQGELERCRRVEQSMREREAELSECLTRIRELQAASEKTRTELKKAGLARERAALLEQKQSMLAELSDLTTKKTALEARFSDGVPTSRECDDALALYDRIKAVRARAEALKEPSSERQSLERLQKTYPHGLPTAEELARPSQRLRQLQEIDARLAALTSARRNGGESGRFAKGLPSVRQINEAFEHLARAKSLLDEITLLRSRQREEQGTQKRAFPTLPLLFLIFAFCTLALSFLDAFVGARVLLWCVSAGALAGSAVGFLLHRKSRSAKSNSLDRLARTLREKEHERESILSLVRELLSSYGMPCDLDLSRRVAELNLLATQYRADEESRRQREAEWERLCAREKAVASEIGEFLSLYLPTPQRADYAARLDVLKQDALLAARLEQAKRERAKELSDAERERTELQERLLPFLRRYDPKGSKKAGEALGSICTDCTEHRRLTREIEEKTARLSTFVASRGLGEQQIVDAKDFEALNRTDEEQRAEIEQLQQRLALLRTTVDRLSLDSDRIPDLEEQIRHLDALLEEYRANSATIASTQKLLEEAKTALSTRYLDGMQKSFSRFLSLLTKDAPEALMDTSFEVRLREGGQTRSIESFSRGWRDAVRFCVRLSLADALYAEGEKPFLLLDDPFVNLDDRRLAAARALLDTLSKDYQIVYMVCHEERT